MHPLRKVGPSAPTLGSGHLPVTETKFHLLSRKIVCFLFHTCEEDCGWAGPLVSPNTGRVWGARAEVGGHRSGTRTNLGPPKHRALPAAPHPWPLWDYRDCSTSRHLRHRKSGGWVLRVAKNKEMEIEKLCIHISKLTSRSINHVHDFVR